MPRKPPRSTEERLVRAQKSMMPGTLGGRVASAAPMALDVTRLDPRLRANPSTGGGFDPNADPVIIGSGAVSGSGTPANPTAGVAGATAVGQYAEADGADSAALGGSAAAYGDRSVAILDGTCQGHDAVSIGWGAESGWGGDPGDYAISIGYQAKAHASYAVAIGEGAAASDNSAVAVGAGAAAGGDSSAAFGPGATANAADSVAVGHGATATDIGQVVLGNGSGWHIAMGTGLGTKNGIVVKDDDGSGNLWRIRVNIGVLGVVPA